MKFDLPKESYNAIVKTISSFNEIEKAMIFGSRSTGNSKKGSDVDIALKGDKLSYEIVLRLSAILNQELPLPYFFDVVDYRKIKNIELNKEIDRYGKVIYSRD